MNQEVLRSVEKTSRDLETYDRNFQKVMQKSEAQAETANDSGGRVQTSVQVASDASEGLTDIRIVEEKLNHITDLLTETRISSSPTSLPSTPALSREVSDISFMNSSQGETASNVLSSRSDLRPVSQNSRQANIASEHPLLQFKDNQVRLSAHTLLPI
jgi:hypothetical protein